MKALAGVRPRDLVPITPAIAEPSTGETMGESAEKMAKINAIPREEQDQFALRSHRLAAAGTQDGRLTAEIAPVFVPPKFERDGERQRHPRRHDDRAAARAQAGVRSRSTARVTAGNASPLTDGAQRRAAHERRTRAERSATRRSPTSGAYAYAALDPGEQLLMGPVLAAPVALAARGADAR